MKNLKKYNRKNFQKNSENKNKENWKQNNFLKIHEIKSYFEKIKKNWKIQMTKIFGKNKKMKTIK